MASKLTAQQFETLFDDVNADGKIVAPGKAGLLTMFEAHVDRSVSEEQLEEVFTTNDWSESQSFDRKAYRILVTGLFRVTFGDEEEEEQEQEEEDVNAEFEEAAAVDLANLCDVLYHREKTKDYPVVRPSDLQTEAEKESAINLLSLADKIEHVKLESYVAAARQKALAPEFERTGQWPSEPDVHSQDLKKKVSEWTYANYYVVARRFFIMESFEKKQFQHRCDEETFIPLIPPQSLEDEDRKKLAYSTYSKVKANLLPRIEKALWQAFSAIQGIVEVFDSVRFDVTEKLS